MHRILFLLIFSFTSQLLYCQSGWYQVYSSQTEDPDVLCFINSTTGYAGGGSYLYKTTNGAANWSSTFIDTGSIGSISFPSQNVGYLSTSSKIYKTTNAGVNWIQKYTDVNYSYTSFKFFSDSVGIVLGGRSNYSGLYCNLLRTTDGGNNWYPTFNADQYLFSSVSFINQLTGFISTVSYGNSHILKTTDAGQSWVIILSYVPNIEKFIYLTSTRICAIESNSLIVSINGGISWSTKVSGNYVFSDIVQTDSLSLYAVGYSGDIFKTFDKGDHWYLQSSNTTANLSHVYFPNPLTGYISGWYNSAPQIIMKTTDGGGPVGIQNIGSNIPNNFSLSQNYPNPFNPSTKIKFDISKSTYAKIRIYDILGNEVADLMHEQLNPGSYEVEWDASNFASGLYFYKLVARQVGSSTGDYVETKKMVLLK
jgi:photosystem II stability/assembly factor-like uncharacterized protein